jgi:iron uptake system EfeUOB component EfeO/EfeM
MNIEKFIKNPDYLDKNGEIEKMILTPMQYSEEVRHEMLNMFSGIESFLKLLKNSVEIRTFENFEKAKKQIERARKFLPVYKEEMERIGESIAENFSGFEKKLDAFEKQLEEYKKT